MIPVIPTSEPSTVKRGGAFFVDFDNLFHGLLAVRERGHERALEEALALLTAVRVHQRERGTALVLGRAYSAFDEAPGSEAAHALALIGYEPQYVIHGKGRNSADLQLSLDLLEVLLSRRDIDSFVILGGDQDFLPIARKVLEARRQLLIVSPAPMTSGDLLDRIGPDRFVDALSLLELDGQNGSAATAEAEPPVEPRRGARILGHTKLPMSTWSPRSDEEALGVPRQEKCIALLRTLAQRFAADGTRAPEVWLSPFLKNEMAEHFPDLTHPQRRRLVNLLKDQQRIRIEERQSQTGPYPYSVVLLEE